MSTDHRTQVEELMADYRRSRERLAETRHELSSISETAHNKDGSVQVVVGPQGVLREVRLAEDAYQRQRPAQLAATIVELTAAAAQAASRRAADVLAEVLPTGTDPELLLGGRADGEPDPALRREPPPAAGNAVGGPVGTGPAVAGKAADDWAADDWADEDFSEGSWLQQDPAERKW